MKKNILPAALAFVALASAALLSEAKKGSEPVLMTVNGKDVPVSEFVYLFEKNNQQQAQPQSMEEYVGMFERYKLKVADAEAQGIDTTAAFQAELRGYVTDLAAPYLNDSSAIARDEELTYSRMATNRLVSHIMLPSGRTPDERAANIALLDSLRGLLLEGADFADLARRYSSDRSVTSNNGSMGWVNVGKFPYPFENAAFTTPVGEISEVFDDAPFGFHIVKVMAERPNPGQVQVRHILLLTRGLDEAQAASVKLRADSLLAELRAGADFDDLAKRFSDDPGSAAKGGMLPWFGPGQMVEEFEQTSFALPDGEISEPIKTAYGWHIIQKLGHQPVPSFSEERPAIQRMIARDESRSKAPRRERISQLRQQWGVQPDAKVLSDLDARMKAEGGMTPAMLSNLHADWTTVAKLPDGSKVLLSDVAAKLPAYTATVPAKVAHNDIAKAANQAIDEAVENAAIVTLQTDNTDFRNQVKEYHDGILLFDVSNARVWEKATADSEGLESFFSANRDRYAWAEPKFRAYIISAASDSVAAAATALLSSLSPAPDSLAKVLRDNFGRDVKVERKVMARGDDPVVDYLAFNGPMPDDNGRWKAYISYMGEMLEQPAEAADVRPQVVTDYQQWLEDQWVEELRQKYPVSVNQKELKKLLKKNAAKN